MLSNKAYMFLLFAIPFYIDGLTSCFRKKQHRSILRKNPKEQLVHIAREFLACPQISVLLIPSYGAQL